MASTGSISSQTGEMLVTTEWLDEHLTDENVVVLFIGHDRAEFDAGHIPAARFVRLDDLVEQRAGVANGMPPLSELQGAFEAAGVNDTSRIVLCGEEGGVFAARAWFTFDYLGFGSRACLLDGGVEKWKRERRPVSRQTHPNAPGHITPRLQREAIVTAEQMQDLSYLVDETGSSEYAVVDTRPAVEFHGLVPSQGIETAGHIPGALNVYWKTLFRPGTCEFLPAGGLAARLRDAGIRAGQTVITYYRTGMKSSVVHFVARYLGYRAAMYDGSIHEWVNVKGKELVVTSEFASGVRAV